jgi:hypothetical protein
VAQPPSCPAYTLTAADLDTNVVWDQPGDLRIDFIDEPTGSNRPSGSRKRQLLTLHFGYDPQTREFTEARLAPEAVSTPVNYSSQPK